MRFNGKSTLLMVLGAIAWIASFQQSAHAVLGSFEVADGYGPSFARDVWTYDAGQTGAPYLPANYNTGRWKELYGSSFFGDSQYVSQHGVGGSAITAPYALAVRSASPSLDSTYNMSVEYALGTDDLGVAPTTLLQSATIDFDICPGQTFVPGTGFDTVFNDVPAFSLGIGGTDPASGITVGFTDHDPANSFRSELMHFDGGTFNSTPVLWSGSKFDHIQLNIDFVTQTYDLLWTKDFNLATTPFDAGNTPVVIASGVNFTNAFSALDFFYFRAHTDPSDGTAIGGLEKSYLDNFQFAVTQVIPEPSSVALMALGAMALLGQRRREVSYSLHDNDSSI